MGNSKVKTIKQFDRITKLEHLRFLAEARRSVVCPRYYAWSKPKPAAVVLNLQARMVLRLIEEGLFVYHPKPKPKYKTWTPKRNLSKKCGESSPPRNGLSRC